MLNGVDNASFLLQLYSLMILMKDYNNSDLMNELQTQDEVYLKKIIEQNNKIIELLERREYGRINKEN